MLGTAAILLIYLALIGRGLRIGIERTDAFGKLLATGLTTIVAVQTFVIVGGVTRLIPLTGVTLPFVSYGGSSLVANFVILALLIRVSAGPWSRKAPREPADPPAGDRARGAVRPALHAGVLHPGLRRERDRRQPRQRTRQIIAEYKVERGQIITADGTVIALSSRPVRTRASIRAALPAGPAVRRHHGVLLADLRQDRGGAGHEQLPVGRRAGARRLDVRRPGAGPAEEGRHVITTIDARLQKAASDALGSQPGAVVASIPQRRHPRDGLEPHVRSERVVVTGPGAGRRRGSA